MHKKCVENYVTQKIILKSLGREKKEDPDKFKNLVFLVSKASYSIFIIQLKSKTNF